jgi:hypothetical protein
VDPRKGKSLYSQANTHRFIKIVYKGSFSLMPLRIIDGKRKGKPNAYGASLTFPIMRKLFYTIPEALRFHALAMEAVLLRYRFAEPRRKVKRY